MSSYLRLALVVAVALVHGPVSVAAQSSEGLEFNGLPALNYDSDEGFGYGVLSELYHYGDGTPEPYLWTLQPTLFLTTEGRRDITAFFDSPAMLGPGWRIDAFAGIERQIATPYYGIGNDSAYDPSLETDADPFYYRYGRRRVIARMNLQRRVGNGGLRVLVGWGLKHARIDAVPEDEGTTLLEEELSGAPVPGGWSNDIRVGIIRDTRDRQTGPTRGSWSELLVQRIDAALGSSHDYTRVTLTDRRYLSLRPGFVLANRVLLQHVEGDAPFYDLFLVQTSFKQQEGLGGSNTLRGVPKNRYVGKGMALWNAELRWRFTEFEALGRRVHLVASAFFDAGRVWAEGLEPGELLDDLHHGYGGGLRVGAGENFVVALEGGRSPETDLALYIGVGYLF